MLEPPADKHFRSLCAEMHPFDLKVIVSRTVVLKLAKRLHLPLSAAEDLAASAFAILWERDPQVKQDVISLLCAQSYNLYWDERREKMRDSKNAGKFVVPQLLDMLGQDPHDATTREEVLYGIETALANMHGAARDDNAVDRAFLDVLLTDPNAIRVETTWHLKIGVIAAALASRGFNVSHRDVDNMRDRLRRNPDFRAAIALMRNHRGSRPRRGSRASR